MDPSNKKTKKFLIVAAIAYVAASMLFGLFTIIQAYDCVSDEFGGEEIALECLEEADNRNTVFQIMFGVVQVAGIGFVIYLLLQHNKKRREMYGHNTVQNAALDQQMQQQTQQPPVQGTDDGQEKK